MYTQIFLVTPVRGRVLAPQIVAIASLSFFGAKMPFPAFFMAAAAFLIVVFVVFATVVFATVLVVVVIAIEGRKCKHALSAAFVIVVFVVFATVVFATVEVIVEVNE